MSIDIHYRKGDRQLSLTAIGNAPAIALNLLRDTIEDIGDEIEEQAKRKVNLGDTGQLKAHPVDRSGIRTGATDERIPAFGGGFSVRGPRGRFVKTGSAFGGAPGGSVVASEVISVPEEPFYAKYYHFGTGIFGKYKTYIVSPTGKLMKFTWQGKKYRAYKVRGQKAKPYLEQVYAEVNATYIPIKVAQLRAQINALT